MHVDALVDDLSFALKLDEDTGIAAALDKLIASFEALITNTGNADFQTNFKNDLSSFRSVVQDNFEDLTPLERDRLSEIDLINLFSTNLAERIQSIIAQNSMTPSVGINEIKVVAENRRKALQSVRNTRNGLKSLGFTGVKLVPGEPNIAFLLPRGIFDNHLSGLIKELRQVALMLRTLSEVAGESHPEIEVKTISTTDPVFTFGAAIKLASVVGAVITWGLHTLKQVEEIKQLRASSQGSALFTDQEVEKIFGPKIKSIVDKRVAEMIKELQTGKASVRDKELANGLEAVLRSVLSRLERGMQVQILFIAKEVERPVEDEEGNSTTEVFIPEEQLKLVELANKIEYDPSDTAPALAITFVDDSGDNEEAKEEAPKPPSKKARPKKSEGGDNT